jgi:predicted esterase
MRELPHVSLRLAFSYLLAALAPGLTSCDLAETLNRGLGETCESGILCDEDKDLTCAGDGTCQPLGAPGTGELGDACDERVECRIEYECHVGGACVTPGVLLKGQGCDLTNYCLAPLICAAPDAGTLAGICRSHGDAGTALEDEDCEDFFDCGFGLLCGPDRKCQKLPFYRGRSCKVSEADNGPIRGLFEVTEAETAPDEFYRAPFPADFRKKRDGHIDLSGHPEPGTGRKADMAAAYFRAVEEDTSAFSSTSAVFLRFSDRIDQATVECPGDSCGIRFRDVDPGSPFMGEAVPFLSDYRISKGKYICENRLAVRPADGFPLRHATTYAVYVLSTVIGENGETLARDPDFEAMLGITAPGESRLTAAYASFAPFRGYLAAEGIDPATVLTASVFTTSDPDERVQLMREAVHAGAVASALSVTVCGNGVESPCADDGTGEEPPERQCRDHETIHEVHLEVSMPVFQKGAPPYLFAAAGGGIFKDEDGKVSPDKRLTTCAALTIPKDAAMPADGWPLVIYGHGTGGNFRGFARLVAPLLADVRDGDGNSIARFAMLGFDQVQHGPRRGGLNVSPESLFFNFLNPWAARDNTLQGAADVFSLVRFVKEELKLAAADSPTGEEVRFDPNKIMYFGHSQGTVTGPPALVHEPDVAAIVMSGAGGHLVQSLLNKTQPVNIADGIRLALADDGVDEFHEILHILQHHIAPSDTINYGRHFFADPPPGVPPKHVLHIYGLRDNYAPEPNQLALAQSMETVQVGTVLRAIEGLDAASPGTGVKSNIVVGGGAVTAAVIQYEPTKMTPEQAAEYEVENYDPANPPDAYDGHFVAFRNEGAARVWSTFLGTAARDGIPTIRP